VCAAGYRGGQQARSTLDGCRRQLQLTLIPTRTQQGWQHPHKSLLLLLLLLLLLFVLLQSGDLVTLNRNKNPAELAAFTCSYGEC
jgi:hypothetical protein